MDQHGWVLFFLQMSLMHSMALLGGYVMRKLHHPSVLGELLGGIILGPTIFGMIAPGPYDWLFPAQPAINSAREAVITLGMLFFLFSAGLEINLAQLNGRVWAIILTSILGVLIPFGLGYGAVLAFPRLWGESLALQGFVLPVFIGTALSISALPVIARILMDLDLLDKEIGSVIITSAVINDLIGWSLFAATLSALEVGSSGGHIWGTFGLVIGVILLVWVLSRILVPPFLIWVQKTFDWTGGFISVIAVWIFAAAAATEQLGLHPVLGAFQVGVILGQSLNVKKNHPAYEVIQQFAISFFAPLYFVSVGLKANFIKDFDLLLVVVVLLVASLGKIAGASLGAWLGGMSVRESLAVGSGLNARGAIEIILASVALEYRIIDQRIFVALVIMALVTSMFSGPLMQKLIRGSELPYQ
jgi:Kef-type K+ transport system membrane component KefB